MRAIVSVTNDWGIGQDGQLLVRNRADMRHFVELTRGCTVLMGRMTFESFSKGPLRGRRNVVVSHDGAYERRGFPRAGSDDVPGYEVCTSIEDALAAVAADPPDRVWLIGGERLYRTLLPSCSEAVVTKNDVRVPADAFFPNLDEDPTWEVAHDEDGGTTLEGVPFRYVTYRRV